MSFCFPSHSSYHKYPFTEIVLSLSGSYARFSHILKTLFFKADKLLQIMPCSTALLSLAFCTAAAVGFAVVNGIRDMISASSTPVHLARLENAEDVSLGQLQSFHPFPRSGRSAWHDSKPFQLYASCCYQIPMVCWSLGPFPEFLQEPCQCLFFREGSQLQGYLEVKSNGFRLLLYQY